MPAVPSHFHSRARAASVARELLRKEIAITRTTSAAPVVGRTESRADTRPPARAARLSSPVSHTAACPPMGYGSAERCSNLPQEHLSDDLARAPVCLIRPACIGAAWRNSFEFRTEVESESTVLRALFDELPLAENGWIKATIVIVKRSGAGTLWEAMRGVEA